jgi:hypothetical protein
MSNNSGLVIKVVSANAMKAERAADFGCNLGAQTIDDCEDDGV